MFTSAELPMHGRVQGSATADSFGVLDDSLPSPRASHRAAIAFILAASIGGYALIYVIGSLAGRVIAGL